MRGYYIKNCKQMERYVVIMAGGAGERFWPLSRKSKPKHLWNVVGGDACLLSMTYSRARETVGGENIFVVTNPEQVGRSKRTKAIRRARWLPTSADQRTSAQSTLQAQ
mgnify:CR=1 FL=1